ncbi:MAG: transglycosylase SLT domain-containing protein [Cyanobacteriota bacterium]|nr:transglycosylase SLT domain-containing protein [Cyanobacteriota bacterium]
MRRLPLRPLLIAGGVLALLTGPALVACADRRGVGGATAAESGSALPPPPAAAATSGALPPPPAAALLPSDPTLPRSGDGRHYPLIPSDPAAIATLLGQVETLVRSPDTPEADLPALGHQQQVIYRTLSRQPDLAEQVRPLLDARWRSVFDRHLAARREFLAMHRGPRSAVLPAWRIIRPEPPETLRRHYREAAAATGIPWEVLAAVNLVETGMGRIDGVSVADAQGPMQFLPTTWAEPGIGNGGDIRDPRTAIHAAARYLVRRGGLKDIRRGLWGYNNSDHYGKAVLLYADLLREDPQAFRGLYHWEIHFASSEGDLWLPVGYDQPRPIPVSTYLSRFPVSAPPPLLAGG